MGSLYTRKWRLARPGILSQPRRHRERPIRRGSDAAAQGTWGLAMTERSIKRNLEAVRDEIATAARAVDRDPAAITLVAVSKTKPAADVVAAYEAGQRHFGENRVQEAVEKLAQVRPMCPNLVMHLIGPLQTNKVRLAVANFDVIESVDRPKLARALAEEMARAGRNIPCLIQVNVGEEAQKSGIAPADADAFIQECRDTLGLSVRGLMCIPPADVQPDPYFAFLAELARRNGLEWLSMGMSADFEAAIQQGATHVRVGTAIFGVRRPVAAH